MDSANDPILNRAIYLAQRKCSVQSVMMLILYDLRAPINYTGFEYLIKAVQIAVNRGCTHIVAAELYEAVCAMCDSGVDARSVEAAIRAVIRNAWKMRMDGMWNLYFPEYIVNRRKPPTNLEFITAIVYFVYLWQDCCGKEAPSYASV